MSWWLLKKKEEKNSLCFYSIWYIILETAPEGENTSVNSLYQVTDMPTLFYLGRGPAVFRLQNLTQKQKQKKTASFSLCVNLLPVCKVNLYLKGFFKKLIICLTNYIQCGRTIQNRQYNPSLLRFPSSNAPCWLPRPQSSALALSSFSP